MEKTQKKRPHTLKQRIRSWVWNFLLEDPPEVNINPREIAQLVHQAVRTTTDDSGEVVKPTSSQKEG